MMIMGHRGAKALEPENTLLSIRRAMEIGVDAVEIDVHLTKDKEVVVIHDSTVDRTTNGKGPVGSYTLEEIKKLDAGKGEKIPTLKEVIEFVKDKVRLIIELKEEGTEDKVVELIKGYNMFDSAYIISFWHMLVKKIKEMDSRIKTGVLLVGCPVDTCIARSASADALVMNYAFVSKGLVDKAHQEGLKVFIWNIDDRDMLKPYVDMGVDGIGSNDPRILVEYFVTI
ncbi:MAG: glycerophosphodiester phosphodiesterase family protein [Thermodesulfobacteriota bacterium]|nr:glycerophosphodiester phosphodiesterase family protein [Desulfovibrionales bacterium]MDQ7838902.1 glycerophosphodiester phosphodiesterase family protein [Thermodesulfobacteriota bacterium]